MNSDAARVDLPDQRRPGRGSRVRSNASVPLHVSHGLSSSTQPSGIRAAWRRVTSSSTCAGPVDDVAPLDQLELATAAARAGRPVVGVVVAEHLRERADVELLVEPRARLTQTSARSVERREAARRLLADLAAVPPREPGNASAGDVLARGRSAPAGRAREERDRRVRAAASTTLIGRIWPRRSTVLAALAAAEEVLVRAACRTRRRPAATPSAGWIATAIARAGARSARPCTRRRAARLVRRDLVDVRRVDGDHLRQRVLVAGPVELVAEPGVLVLGDDRLAVVEHA